MKSVSVIKWLLVPLFLLAVFPVFAGKPQAVKGCNTVIDEPGKYRLTKDLGPCEGFGVGIIASDVTLDLKGHTVSCNNDGELSVGVEAGMRVPVQGVKITNGYITGCAGGVLLGFADDSTVTKITTWGNYAVDNWDFSGLGIFVFLSNNNVIMNNIVYENEKFGISTLWGSGNLYKHNTVLDNGVGGPETSGIDLVGENNSRILCNRVHGNGGGIVLAPDTGPGFSSSGNLLRGNVVTGNLSGIGMLGFAWEGNYVFDISGANMVRSNIVEDNYFNNVFEMYVDLAKGGTLLHPHGTCMNDWMKNQYGPPVFGPEGCFGTPVTLDDDDVCALDGDD